MSSNLPYKQAANVERRTWDKEAYEAKAKARIQAENNNKDSKIEPVKHQIGQKRSLTQTILNDEEQEKEEFQAAEKGRAGPMNSKRAFLKARSSNVDLEAKVGTSEIINPEEAAKSSIQVKDGVSKVASGVGWYCKVCDCYLKDSLAYLDHINGRKHQRALGFSMRTAKSTTEDVTSKLKTLADAKKKKEEEDIEAELMTNKNEDHEDGKVNEFEKIVKQKDEEIAKRKADRAKRREERRKKLQEEKEKAKNPMALMSDNGNNEEEEVEEEGNTSGLHPDLAKMMGFSGFA